MAAGFARCYANGARQNPQMAGQVKMVIMVGPSGQVLSAVPFGGDGLSTQVIACVAGLFKGVVFSPPAHGVATLVIPVTLPR